MPPSRTRIRTHNPTVSGGGGGATTFNQYVIFFEKVFLNPTTYSTGGFVIDLSATYSSLNAFKLMVKKGTRGNVPYGRFKYQLNVPAAGQVTVTLHAWRQERVSSFDNVGAQPAGVTVQAAVSNSSAEAAHTHNADHDHSGAFTAAMTAAGAGVDTDALAPGIATHTHAVNLDPLAVTTGAGTSHLHQDDSIYQHQHTLTHVATMVSEVELTNATNLSATTFLGCASGVRA